MRKRKVVCIPEDEMLDYLKGKQLTRLPAIPADARFISVSYNPMRGQLEIVIESETFDTQSDYLEVCAGGAALQALRIDRSVPKHLYLWSEGDDLPPPPQEWGVLPAIE